MGLDFEKFEALLKAAVQNEISDIHIRPNERPYFRNRGDLIPVKVEPFSESDIKEICVHIIADPDVKNNLSKINEYDGSFAFKNYCRLRYNLFKYQGKIGVIFRVISNKIPTIDELNLSPTIANIANQQRGLILVTGATGSGKSSTLAAMIHHINTTRSDHILTIEDPVEFLHVPKKSRITQREIGHDTKDFKVALRAALRQDPDVILIGEMRDSETMDIALKAAETGHVVFATIHTTDALNTIGRLVSMFPPEEQHSVRTRLADNLYAAISQRLLPTIDGKKSVAAQEIMVTTIGIKDCISGKNPMSGIYTFIENGFKEGRSQSYDQHITQLYQNKIISMDVARSAATSPEDFERNLVFTRDS